MSTGTLPSKLEAALAYGRMGWRVFPCHSIIQTPAGPTCSCRKRDCTSPGKHPRIKQGFRGASDDAVQIKAWWTRYPDANIGLATGSGLAVFDIDGVAGANEFKALVQAHGTVPETLSAATGRGVHLVFSTPHGTPEVRSSARGNVHVRGEGGYIIAAPSDHISGRKYQWIKRVAVAELPTWLRQWSQGYEVTGNQAIANPSPFKFVGRLPDYLKINQTNVTRTASEALKTTYSQAEHARLVSALAAIPSDSYDIWYQVGMALKTLEWERSDGTDVGLELFDQWSQTCPEKYAQAACEFKWRSFGRRAGITLGTVYHLAREHGWNGGLPAIGPGDVSPPPASPSLAAPHLNGHANGVNGNHALPAAFVNAPQAIFFPDLTEEGKPRATFANAVVAVRGLGVECRHDLFHNRMRVAGEPIAAWKDENEISDNIVHVLRSLIRYRFGFDPNKVNTADACMLLCLQNQYDPVLDYLAGLQWDGIPRLDRWLITYMGAPDTDLNRQFGRLSLLAAVRRARYPGTKFDQITVFEGPEGKGKSDAIRALAGAENFSDQRILTAEERVQQELIEGVWLYEIGELSGINKAEIEHVKAFASRTVDRTRPAYGRFRVDKPRRTIFFATTNRNDYLMSDTGNRRFWPVVTTTIDVEGIRRDRDQIWAEAAQREAAGESTILPERFWNAATALQDQRLARDSWLECIDRYVNMDGKQKHDVSILEVLVENQFIQRRADQVGRSEQIRAGNVLRQLGFERYHKRIGPTFTWRYRRG